MASISDIVDSKWDDVDPNEPSDNPGLEYFFGDDNRVVVLWLYARSQFATTVEARPGVDASTQYPNSAEWVNHIVSRFAHALLVRHVHEPDVIIHSADGVTLARVAAPAAGAAGPPETVEQLKTAMAAVHHADGLLPDGADELQLPETKEAAEPGKAALNTTPPADVTFVLVAKELQSLDDISRYVDAYQPHIFHISAFGDMDGIPKVILRSLFRNNNIRCCLFNTPESKRIALLCSTGVHASVGIDSPDFRPKDGFVYFKTFLENLVLYDATYVEAHLHANAAIIASYKSLKDHALPRPKMMVALERFWDDGASKTAAQPAQPTQLNADAQGDDAPALADDTPTSSDAEPLPPAPTLLPASALGPHPKSVVYQGGEKDLATMIRNPENLNHDDLKVLARLTAPRGGPQPTAARSDVDSLMNAQAALGPSERVMVTAGSDEGGSVAGDGSGRAGAGPMNPMRPLAIRSSKIKASVVTQAPVAAAGDLASATDAASYHCIPTLAAYKRHSVTRLDIEAGPTDVDMDDDASVNTRLLASALDPESLEAFDENDMSVRVLQHLCEADFDEYMQEKAVYVPDPSMYTSIVALALTDKQRSELLVTARDCAGPVADVDLAKLIYIPPRAPLASAAESEAAESEGLGRLEPSGDARVSRHRNITTSTTTRTLNAASNQQNGGLVVHIGVPPSTAAGDAPDAVASLNTRAAEIEAWAATNTAPSDLVIINWNSMRADERGEPRSGSASGSSGSAPQSTAKGVVDETAVSRLSAGSPTFDEADIPDSRSVALFTYDTERADDLTQLFCMMAKAQQPAGGSEAEAKSEASGSDETKAEEEGDTPLVDELYAGPAVPAALYVVGSPGCGKTSFLSRFVLDAYRYLAPSTTVLHWFCDVRDLDSLEPYYFIHGISAQLVRAIPHLRDALHRVRKLLSPGNVARNPVKVFEKAVLAPLSAYFTELAAVSKHNATLADDRLSTMVVLVLDGLDESLALPDKAPTCGLHTIHSILAATPEEAFPPQFRLVISTAGDASGAPAAVLPQPCFAPAALPSRFGGLCGTVNLDLDPVDVLEALVQYEAALEGSGGPLTGGLAASGPAHPGAAQPSALLKDPAMRELFHSLLTVRTGPHRLSLFQLHTLYYWCDPVTDMDGLRRLVDEPELDFYQWLVYEKALCLSLPPSAPLYDALLETRQPAVLALAMVLTSVQLLSPTLLLDAMDLTYPQIMFASRTQSLALLEGQLMPLLETQLDPLLDLAESEGGESKPARAAGESGQPKRSRVRCRKRVRRSAEEALDKLDLDHGVTEIADSDEYEYEYEYETPSKVEGGASAKLPTGSASNAGAGDGGEGPDDALTYMEDNFLVPYSFRDPYLRYPTAQVRMSVAHAALLEWLDGQDELLADGKGLAHAVLAVVWITASFLTETSRISGADALQAQLDAFVATIRPEARQKFTVSGATEAFVRRYSTYERFSLVAQHLARAECGRPEQRAALLSSCVDVNVVTDKGNLSLFMEAAWRGDVTLVEFLLHLEDLDVNARNYDGASALHFAAGWGQAEVIELLLSSPLSGPVIDVNSISKMGCSPLYMAAERNHVAAVDVLLTAPDIDVNLTGDMNTPLHVAAALGYVDVVASLVSHPRVDLNAVGHMNCTPLLMASSAEVLDVILSADGVDVNCSDQDGITLLYFAAQRSDVKTVRKLLSMPGINVSPVESINGKTPLRVAADKGSSEIVRLLLEVCEPEAVNDVAADEFSILQSAAEYGHTGVVRELVAIPALDVNAKNAKDGLTALHYAAAKGHAGVVAALLDRHDLDVNILNRHMCTALYTAAMHNHEAVVADLLARGRNIDVNLPDSHKYTPCHIAVDKNNLDVVMTLLDNPECNINAPAEMGLTPLHAAAYRGNAEVVRVLLLAPALDVNAMDKESRTPLLVAAMHGKHKVCELLVHDSRVNVNIADRHGYLPLHMAADKGRLLSVRALLSVPGVHVNAAAEQGVTPLHAASYENRRDVVQELLSYEGIKVNVAAAKDGATPLQIASDRGNAEVVELLLEAGAVDPRGKARKAASVKGYLNIVALLDAPRCGACFKSSTTLQECAGCHKVVYCSRTCQKRAWKEHKFVCNKRKR
ncbi:uncharacterized protein AMSG_04892 [Thecamonas trahens ATCC 50062]|uniref:MYND-type domain-containing protein n=1 Tax=Thecamonas trahens ATCC 50062 TaxID=461836 RepID=A0A0L0D8N5_THETB|nr:hypothetical protein AMSG_04892 [Thecamonas trahens ATCC 50062]KNC48446.1 hypothetical protein AMSG_04892 [Thecamonas trahens ATCC 50062]|eukprot:XP_013758559.1 hypothetical protein AMSG_04892 [Thecamonas trahens ATCC 50062]